MDSVIVIVPPNPKFVLVSCPACSHETRHNAPFSIKTRRCGECRFQYTLDFIYEAYEEQLLPALDAPAAEEPPSAPVEEPPSPAAEEPPSAVTEEPPSPAAEEPPSPAAEEPPVKKETPRPVRLRVTRCGTMVKVGEKLFEPDTLLSEIESRLGMELVRFGGQVSKEAAIREFLQETFIARSMTDDPPL
jgi:hypothetical protein